LLLEGKQMEEIQPEKEPQSGLLDRFKQSQKQKKQQALDKKFVKEFTTGETYHVYGYYLDLGANVNALTADGKTMLDVTNNSERIKDLLKRGCQFTQKKSLDRALYLCDDSIETIGELLGMGADINDQNIQDPKVKNTLLHIAVSRKDIALVQFLVDKQARTDIKNAEEETAVELTRRLYRETKDYHFQKMLTGAFKEDLPDEVSEMKILADKTKATFIYDEPELGQHITASFNFATAFYREVVYCEETNTQSHVVIPLSQLENNPLFIKAEEEVVKLGGKPYSRKSTLNKA
jgi:hypothetical protein